MGMVTNTVALDHLVTVIATLVALIVEVQYAPKFETVYYISTEYLCNLATTSYMACAWRSLFTSKCPPYDHLYKVYSDTDF